MCSPIGHSILGMCCAQLVRRSNPPGVLAWAIFVLFCANAPDLDFLAGWIMGDINQYHHKGSHSLAAAVLFGTGCALFAKLIGWHALGTGLVAVLIYASHLLADMLTLDPSPPYGMQLMWPLNDSYYIATKALFGPVAHGQVGDGVRTVFSRIFSPANASVALMEVAVLSPVVLFSWWRRRWP